MCPALAELGAQLLLVCRKNLPVMQCVRLLSDADKRRRFSFTDIRTDFSHLGQAAAEVIAAVAYVEFGIDVDHVTVAQLGHATGIALGLNLTKAGFAGMSSFNRCKTAASFRAGVGSGHLPSSL